MSSWPNIGLEVKYKGSQCNGSPSPLPIKCHMFFLMAIFKFIFKKTLEDLMDILLLFLYRKKVQRHLGPNPQSDFVCESRRQI